MMRVIAILVTVVSPLTLIESAWSDDRDASSQFLPRLAAAANPNAVARPSAEPDNQKPAPSFRSEKHPPLPITHAARPQRLTNASVKTSEESEESGASKKTANVATFTRAAHFPMVGFSTHFERVTHNALVIYEGMTVSVSSDGTYQMRMVVEAPQVPVTVRMQLHFHQLPSADGPCQEAANTTAGTTDAASKTPGSTTTITLVPMRFQPDPLRELGSPSNTYVVERQGFSPALRGINSRWNVTRSGTARFGAVPR